MGCRTDRDCSRAYDLRERDVEFDAPALAFLASEIEAAQFLHMALVEERALGGGAPAAAVAFNAQEPRRLRCGNYRAFGGPHDDLADSTP